MEKDNNGNMIPMPGVVVYWCDRSFARSTNADGSFEIPVSGTERRLAFSMVGYRKDTLLVTDTLKAIHHMMVKGVELKEVVVSEKQRTQIEGFMDPRNISTITQTGLKQAACCNLAESFENSAAVDVSYADAVTGAKQIQMLGLTGLYTQILTENIPSVRACLLYTSRCV